MAIAFPAGCLDRHANDELDGDETRRERLRAQIKPIVLSMEAGDRKPQAVERYKLL